MMQPHEERVVAEKAELDERVRKLQSFVCSEAFKSVKAIDRTLLLRQHAAMCSYQEILGLRIRQFTHKSPVSR